MRRAALQPLIKRCEDLHWRRTSRLHAVYPMPGVAGAFFTFGGVYALGTSKDSGAGSVKMGVVLGTVGLFFLIAQGVWTVIKARHIRNETASQIDALLEGLSPEQGAQERAATAAPPEATAPRG